MPVTRNLMFTIVWTVLETLKTFVRSLFGKLATRIYCFIDSLLVADQLLDLDSSLQFRVNYLKFHIKNFLMDLIIVFHLENYMYSYILFTGLSFVRQLNYYLEAM